MAVLMVTVLPLLMAVVLLPRKRRRLRRGRCGALRNGRRRGRGPAMVVVLLPRRGRLSGVRVVRRRRRRGLLTDRLLYRLPPARVMMMLLLLLLLRLLRPSAGLPGAHLRRRQQGKARADLPPNDGGSLPQRLARLLPRLLIANVDVQTGLFVLGQKAARGTLGPNGLHNRLGYQGFLALGGV